MAAKDDVLGFHAQWYDPRPQLVKDFVLKYYPLTHEADMTDVKSHRLFLKRSKLPSTIKAGDFIVGGKVIIYGRELSLVEYADPATRNRLATSSNTGGLLLDPSTTSKWGDIIAAAEQSGCRITECRTVAFAGRAADVAAQELGTSPDAFMTGAGVSMLVAFRGAGVASLAAGSGIYPLSGDSNLFQLAAENGSTATFDSCTCCVLKPHAVKAGNVGTILATIQAQGYDVSAMQSFSLSRASAREFLEVYKGVVADYGTVVDEFAAGSVIAMELRAEDAVTQFRKTAGPWDVETAKELFPNTIRAQFGVDNVRNAVHCTDLEGDGKTECEYFFDLLQ